MGFAGVPTLEPGETASQISPTFESACLVYIASGLDPNLKFRIGLTLTACAK